MGAAPGPYIRSSFLFVRLGMKKRIGVEDEDEQNNKELQIIKAVAQAWHSHSATSTCSSNEFDAYHRDFKGKPSRFKLEAMTKTNTNTSQLINLNVKDINYSTTPIWDFGQSLWDSYEIVTVAKKLEAGLVLDDYEYDHHPFTGTETETETGFYPKYCNTTTAHNKRKESKNSLRNLFKRVSSSTSRRFNEAHIPRS